MKLSGGPVFTIKIMTEGQRRELQEKISNAAMEDAQATRDGRESSRVDGLHQEVMVTYVTPRLPVMDVKAPVWMDFIRRSWSHT
jgi:hypothetical protein